MTRLTGLVDTVGVRLAWLTDIHFTYVPPANREAFYTTLAVEKLDALLIGGDIGESDTLAPFLKEIEERFSLPIYFVLGNHDYYHSSIARTRAAISRQAADSQRLHWLSNQSVIALSPTTALVGHDCWGDGRAGDFFGAEVLVNDFRFIEELQCRRKETLLERLHALGDEAASWLGECLAEALDSYPEVIVLTHVPPFYDVSWREGRISDDALPFYVCKAAGDRLAALARMHPDRSITVLSGHTHCGGTIQVLPNLVAQTGAARYGKPTIQRIFEI